MQIPAEASMENIVVYVSTTDFWDAMCYPGFIRTSPVGGKIGKTIYIVDVPPEDVAGFMASKINEPWWAIHPWRWLGR